MMTPLFDNIVWHTLAGPHAKYAVGTDRARRYAQGFPPMIAFADIDKPDFHALTPYVEPDELLYCDGWATTAPAGWRIESEALMCRMTWAAAPPVADEAPEAVPLGRLHASAAFELASLTRPGPFTLRTIELGEYFGIFDGARLVAMGGARTCAGGLGEISGVCTHPELRGKGLARRLVAKLMWRQMQRGETPFLRVIQDNLDAHRLYQRMGFRDYRTSVARTVSRY